MAVPTNLELLTLIYKTEYFIINKDYDSLLLEEYGVDSNVKTTQVLRFLLKALKHQYTLDPTATIIGSLYIKVRDCVGLNLETLPSINNTLVIYTGNNINDILVGSFSLATYPELFANLPADYDKVVSVKVFNDYFSNLNFNVRIYKAFITITNGLTLTHNLSTNYIETSFSTTTGPIICEYTIVDNNTIQLVSNVSIPSVYLTIIG